MDSVLVYTALSGENDEALLFFPPHMLVVEGGLHECFAYFIFVLIEAISDCSL